MPAGASQAEVAALAGRIDPTIAIPVATFPAAALPVPACSDSPDPDPESRHPDPGSVLQGRPGGWQIPATPNTRLAYAQTREPVHWPVDRVPITGGFTTNFSLLWDITLAGNPAFAFTLIPRSALPAAVGFATPDSSGAAAPLVCGSRTGGAEGPFRVRHWDVAVFDFNYVVTTLLPELLHRHLRGDSALDYDIRIIDNQGATPGRVVFPAGAAPPTDFLRPDWQIDLFALRIDCFAPNPPTSTGGDQEPGAVNLAQLLTRKPASCRTASIAESPATSHYRVAEGLWTLQVINRPRSTAGAMATFRRRSVIFSCGVLLVLGLGVFTLILLSERASALAQMRTELVLGVSHELRTPLTVIRVAADNLEKGMASGGPQTRDYGQLIGTEAARLSDMIEDTLTFARLQSGRQSLDTVPVSVAELLKGSLAECEKALREASVAVQVDIAPDLPLIEVNARLMGKCLENLIQNVIRYAAAGHWMALRASQVDRADGRRVQISIEDRGPGICGTDLPHVFEPFYRGKNAAASVVAGLGLGLTFVKRVVEAHRGSIEARVSETGTVFSLFLRC
jgi:two-component system, OmpR family, sensor histidine kinase SenX3